MAKKNNNNENQNNIRNKLLSLFYKTINQIPISETIDNYDILEAPPCRECVKFLLNHGFRHVYFMDDNNKIVKLKLDEDDIDNFELSDAQKQYKKTQIKECVNLNLDEPKDPHPKFRIVF